MNRHTAFWMSCALLISGSVKMAFEAMKEETHLIPTCMGKTLAIDVGHSGLDVLHCWGCYAFVLGLAMLGALTFRNVARKR